MEFAIGDRVHTKAIIYTQEDNSITPEDDGIIVAVDEDGCCDVIFDRNVGGHNLQWSEVHCQNGHGWYLWEKQLLHAEPPCEYEAPTCDELAAMLGLPR